MRDRLTALLCGAVFIAFSWVVWKACTDPRDVDGLTGDYPAESALAWPVDVSGETGMTPIAGSLRPVPNQKKAPCHKYEAEANGHCWLPHALKPPCPAEMAELNGQCVLPVAAMPKTPTSVSE